MNKFWILIVFMLISSNLFAQIDYYKIRKKKLSPTYFDTTKFEILILENKYARIYFKQSDLMEYIELDRMGNNSRPFGFNNLYDDLYSLLAKGKQRITLNDYWYTYSDMDRQEIFGDINYANSEKKYVDDLNMIGSDLIHDGKFIIYNKLTSEFNYKGLRIKRGKGIMGGETLYFRLPNGQSFWTVLLSLGE